LDEENYESDKNKNINSNNNGRTKDKIINNKIKVCLNFDEKSKNQNNYNEIQEKTLNNFQQMDHKNFEEGEINILSYENENLNIDLNKNLNNKKKPPLKPLRAFHFTNKFKNFSEEPILADKNSEVKINGNLKNNNKPNKIKKDKKKKEKIKLTTPKNQINNPSKKIIIPLNNTFDLLKKSKSFRKKYNKNIKNNNNNIDNKLIDDEEKISNELNKSQYNKDFLSVKRKKDQNTFNMKITNNSKTFLPDKNEIQSYIDNKAEISTNYNSFTHYSNYNTYLNNFINQETNTFSNKNKKLSQLYIDELDNKIKNTSYNEIYNMLLEKNEGDDYEFLKELDLKKSRYSQYLPLKENNSDNNSVCNIFNSNQSFLWEYNTKRYIL